MSRTTDSRFFEPAAEQSALAISLERAARTAERAQQQIRRAHAQVLKADAVIRSMRSHLKRHGLVTARRSGR